MVLCKQVQFPAVAVTHVPMSPVHQSRFHGQGRSLGIREDEQFQKLRAKMKTQRGRPLPANGRRWSTRLRINWCTKDVAPDTKASARTSLMAVVMRRSATSR